MSTPAASPPPAPDAFDQALAEYDVQHGVAAPQPAAAPPTPRPASGAARVAAAVGGLLLTLLVTVGTLGLALAAFAGMGAAALVQHRRGRPYTRASGWIGAVAAPTVTLLVLLAAGASMLPRDFTDQVRQTMQQDAARPRPTTAVDSVYARVAPASKAASDAQAKAITDAMTHSSSGTLTALLVFAALFGCGFYGLFIGSAAWGSGAVLQFGLTGRWPAGSPRLSRALRPPPVPPVRDAFDAIR